MIVSIRLAIIIVCVIAILLCLSGVYHLPPDYGLDPKQLIEKYGYRFEKHSVTTEDGYILEIHRIPHGRKEFKESLGPPVLIVHAAASCSAAFVNTGLERSLGFILADLGYDVWLANCRGNTFSRRHTKLDPDLDRKDYWNFSFQEIGAYDIPALIDYVLGITKHKKLFYIGHSQGTSGVFAMTSEKIDYNEKIRLLIALGPGVYFGHTNSSIIHFLNNFKNQVQAFIDFFQFYEILWHSSMTEIVGAIFCNNRSPIQDLCAAVFFLFAGFTPEQMNKTLIPVISTNIPAGNSAKNWQHIAQLYPSKNFQKYDYGEIENMKIYGQPHPPVYNLSQTSAPVAIFLGDTDAFVPKQDVDRAVSEMQNVVHYKYIRGFNHIDVIWGISAVELVFRDIIDLMGRY